MIGKSVILILILSLSLHLSSSIIRYITVLGFFRTPSSTVVKPSAHLVFINDTVQCEDLHYHEGSGQLFLACEDSYSGRFQWFPPLAGFQNPLLAHKSTGSIHVIDPESRKSRRLEFTNFNKPFITHGIDVISDPDSMEPAVYIFAVNHPPVTFPTQSTHECIQKADSRVEVFHHVVSSRTVTHLRSVRHPLISTPNDILARDSRSFYVTNDHRHKEGVKRFLEMIYWGARWSTTVFVEVESLTSSHPEEGVKASVALSGLYNQNGLGRGRPGEILIGSAARGVLEIGHASPHGPSIQLTNSIKFDSTIDNPSYFFDPFANDTFDASGYLVAGLSRANKILNTKTDPNGKDGSMVWYVPLQSISQSGASGAGFTRPKLLFEDDGKRLRSATTAVMVAIDPRLEQGQRWAWVFVTGFMARSVLAIKVNLEDYI